MEYESINWNTPIIINGKSVGIGSALFDNEMLAFFALLLVHVLFVTDGALLYSINKDKSLEYPQGQLEKMTDKTKAELVSEEVQSIVNYSILD